jgi:hypothetical protein
MAVSSGNSTTPFPAILVDPNGRRRVVQDETSTLILVTFLGITLTLVTLAWILMPSTAILPGGPTSIATLTTLLRPGDLLDFLPDDAEVLTNEAIGRCFGPGMRFRLGWKQNESGVDSYMIYTEKPAGYDGG